MVFGTRSPSSVSASPASKLVGSPQSKGANRLVALLSPRSKAEMAKVKEIPSVDSVASSIPDEALAAEVKTTPVKTSAKATTPNKSNGKTPTKSGWGSWWGGGGSGSSMGDTSSKSSKKGKRSKKLANEQLEDAVDEPQGESSRLENEIEPWPEASDKINMLKEFTAEELQALAEFHKVWRDICLGTAPVGEDSPINPDNIAKGSNEEDGGPDVSFGDKGPQFTDKEANMSFSDAIKFVLGRNLDVQQAAAKAVRRTTFFQNQDKELEAISQTEAVDKFLNTSGVYASGVDKNGRPVFWTDFGNLYRTNLDDLRVLLASTDLLSQALINPNFGLAACREGMCFVYDARSLNITDFRMDIAKLMYTWSRTIPTRVARIIFIANMTLRWVARPMVNMFLGKYRDKMHFVSLAEVEQWVSKEYWPNSLGGKKRPGFAQWVRHRSALHERVWPNFSQMCDEHLKQEVGDSTPNGEISPDAISNDCEELHEATEGEDSKVANPEPTDEVVKNVLQSMESFTNNEKDAEDASTTIGPRDTNDSRLTCNTNFDSSDSWAGRDAEHIVETDQSAVQDVSDERPSDLPSELESGEA